MGNTIYTSNLYSSWGIALVLGFLHICGTDYEICSLCYVFVKTFDAFEVRITTILSTNQPEPFES